jgi:hypothetical protein
MLQVKDLPPDQIPEAMAARRRPRWHLGLILLLFISLVTLGPTSFPRDIDTSCPGPDFMLDGDGDCMERGTLILMTGKPSGGRTRSDLERAIAPLGGRIKTAVDLLGIFAVAFPAADTLAELDAIEMALEELGFWASRSWIAEPFSTA